MRKLTMEEIHKYGLGCLIYFDKICRKYGLRYSLAYGTLIGALRHKGFIPWDDDIDVVMMRADYEKLSELFLCGIEQDEVYGFINEKNNEQYHYTIGRLVDKRTRIRFISNEGDVDDMGVFIDIYPVDYIHERYLVRKIINCIMLIVTYGLYVNSDKVKKYKSESCLKSIIERVISSLFCLIEKNKFYDAYYLLLKFLPKKSSCADDLWDRFYLLNGTFDPMWFDDLRSYEFEGHAFYAFCQADVFLKNHYGDYMEYPPLDERVPHHDYEAYLL